MTTTVTCMQVVRYVSEANLRQWKAALQPVASKLLARAPRDALTSLQRQLNGARSPLFSDDFQQRYTTFSRAHVDARKGRPFSGVGGGGGEKRRSGGGGGWGFDALFGRGGGRSGGGSSSNGSNGSGAAAAAAPAPPADPAGHYAALGLRLAPGRSAPGDDEVKGAYRRLVLELHPDRQSGKGAAAQKKAAERFTAVLAAYEVLRDPALRARYDAGELVEASVEL